MGSLGSLGSPGSPREAAWDRDTARRGPRCGMYCASPADEGMLQRPTTCCGAVRWDGRPSYSGLAALIGRPARSMHRFIILERPGQSPGASRG